MAFLTPDMIKSVCGGRWVARPRADGPGPGGASGMRLEGTTALTKGISTDTRTLESGQVYFGLRGERFDGGAFVGDAVRKGASVCVTQDASWAGGDRGGGGEGWDGFVLLVADARRALGKLAGAYRKSLEGSTRVVAVCGSNGKTTTVRILEHVLGSRLRGTASKKSFNNDVGVPTTILSARPSDQFLVCEVGTNAPGEIAALASIVRPDVAVITSIGREHLEKLACMKDVAREEASVLAHVRAGGIGVLNADCPDLMEHARGTAGVVTFGRSEGADLRLTAFEHVGGTGKEMRTGGAGGELAEVRSRFVVNGRIELESPLLGEHNALNCLAALAVAKRLGLSEDEFAAALGTVRGAEQRLWHRIVRGVELFDDSYNANPDSMLAALRTFGSLAGTRGTGEAGGGGRRVFVLGSMLELGEHSAGLHAEVGRAAAGVGVDVLVCVGEAAREYGRAAAECGRTGREGSGPVRVHELDEGDEHLGEKVVSLLAAGDRVLVKGSRGMRLERVRAALERLGPLGPEGAGGLTGTMRTGTTERVRVGRGWGDGAGPGELGARG